MNLFNFALKLSAHSILNGRRENIDVVYVFGYLLELRPKFTDGIALNVDLLKLLTYFVDMLLKRIYRELP